MKRRVAIVFAAALMMITACAQEIPDEAALSASVTAEIATEAETLFVPEPTEADTAELTSPPETEEVTEEITEEITEEVTEEITETSPPETDGIELLTPEQVLQFVEMRLSSYYSFRRRTSTSVAICVLGSETFSETDSELSVKNGEAHFRRGGKDGFENLYLVGDELYTENELGKCRIGGLRIFCMNCRVKVVVTRTQHFP